MPTYVYRCGTCTHQFEVFARMSDPDPEACEQCGERTLEKVLFPVAVHYKGSGFYSTDYSGSRSGGAPGDAKAGDAGSDAGSSSGSDTGSGSSSGSSDAGSTGSGGSSTGASTTD